MGYKDWLAVFASHVASKDSAQEARLWNLEHETRINKQRGLFKRRLGTLYALHIRNGEPVSKAAKAALMEGLAEARPVSSKWLGLLPVASSASAPTLTVTYKSFFRSRKRYPEVFASKGRPRRRITRKRPLDTEKGPDGKWIPRKRFIWVAFSVGAKEPPKDDPTAVKRELGLPHSPEGDFVYRFELPIDSTQACYTPTCLDAGLYEAWKPPSSRSSNPWGQTRDLSDGQPRWPELLVEVKDYLSNTSPKGDLVSPPGTPIAIGPVKPDYMIGR